MIKRLVDAQTGPIAGCFLALVGTYLAAFLLFPDNPAPAGALVMQGSLLAACIVAVPVARLVTGSAVSTNAENFVAFGFVFWLLLDLIQGAYDLGDATPESLQLAVAAIGVSAAAMWIGAMGRAWRLPQWLIDGVSRRLDEKTVGRAIPVCFLLGMSNFAYSVDFDIPAMFSYIGEQRWAAPWGRGQLGGWESFRDQAPYFGYVLPSLTALLIARRGLFKFQSIVAISCSVIMLLFLAQGGGRRIVGVTVGAALMVWVQANPGTRLKNLLVVGVGAIAMAGTAQLMLNTRSEGYQEYLSRGSDYDYLHVDDNILRLAQTIEFVPARRPYVTYRQLVFTLVRPVPRVFWPNKPISAGFDLPTEVGMRGVSLSTSIIGEWYLSYGWLAVIFGGWFHGRLAVASNAIRDLGNRVGNPIVYSLTVMVLIAGLRSMQDLVLMSYALIAWWAVNHFLSRRSPAA